MPSRFLGYRRLRIVDPVAAAAEYSNGGKRSQMMWKAIGGRLLPVSLDELVQITSEKEAASWFFNHLIKRGYAIEIFPPASYDESRDIWFRRNTTDLEIFRSAQRYFGQPFAVNDILLDLGAHIGSVARYYAKQNTGQVIAVEPEPENYQVLEKNLEGTTAQLIRAAVTVLPMTEVQLFINGSSVNRGLASLIPRKSRFAIKVPAITFGELLGCYSPTIMKVDINGTEYDHLETFRQLPTSVHTLMIEVHRLVKSHYPRFGPFIEWLQQDFDLEHVPNFNSGSFVFELIGHRKR